MAMTYQEFKDHLAVFLWKPNDTDLINSLDSLIRMGDAELNRKLEITRREQVVSLDLIGSTVDLPTDFAQLIQVSLAGTPCTRVTRVQFDNLKSNNQSSLNTLNVFYTVGRTLVFPGTFASPGVTVDVYYRQKLPDYQTLDASWMEDEYLDCYTYTVLKHTAPFLREDERVALWTQLSAETITSIIDDDKMNVAFAGGPLHRTIPTDVYGDGTSTRLRGRR